MNETQKLALSFALASVESAKRELRRFPLDVRRDADQLALDCRDYNNEIEAVQKKLDEAIKWLSAVTADITKSSS